MPGPVSDSCPGPTGPYYGSLRRRWKQQLREKGFRYFVLKSADIFEALNYEDLRRFDGMLSIIEEYRVSKGKEPYRTYWVFGRHWPGAEKIKELMERLFGHAVGEPY